ncbi:MAG: TonB-dependent receptor plug domain-containing protein [Gemmatimonadetes bacterium]|nr:TonB-dependent receptor plug domain-containing protein [Gemmatimonadota bacterium]
MWLAFAVALPAAAQAPTGSVQGRVWSDTGLPVVSAVVAVSPESDTLAARYVPTDDLGFFSMGGLEPGSYHVRISALGYSVQVETVRVGPDSDLRADLEVILSTEALELEGFSIEGERSRSRVRFEETAGLSVQDLDREAVKAIPGLAEADPIRAVEVLPGVTTVSDFSAAFNVRGGSADQNLILLDGVPLFNPFHLGASSRSSTPTWSGGPSCSRAVFPPSTGAGSRRS